MLSYSSISYSSISYTSVQLFRLLPIYKRDFEGGCYTLSEWYSYLSPSVKYFHDYHLICSLIAVVCELVVGIGFPFILLLQPSLTRYWNINFISIKPVIDQLQGCYKKVLVICHILSDMLTSHLCWRYFH